MRLASGVCLLAFAAACSRDLTLPDERTLAAGPVGLTVAPREAVTLTTTGGVSPYAFAFADGGALSGPDASVDVATGAYRAGARGSAQDVVVVTDTASRRAEVRITVGARLSLTPAVTAVAPGGTVVLVPSGGKPPYAYALRSGGSGGAVTKLPAGDARYTAGATGDAVDVVVATDATGDDVAAAEARVQVGSAIQLYAVQGGEVAPNDTVSFIVLGGQPPYAFPPVPDAENGSGGAFVDPNTGLWRAGTSGGRSGATDVVTVRDANGQTASVSLRVGPTLLALVATADPRPGVATKILATGGKPPYAFGFADRGDRSHGEVDPLAGLYTPGPSPGTADVLAIADATGLAIEVPAARVGPRQLAPGPNVLRCVAGDFDGNGVRDLVFLHRHMKVTEVTQPDGDAPQARTYFVGTDFASPATLVADVDANRRDELLFLGAASGAPTDPTLNAGAVPPGGLAGLWGLVPDLSGAFSVGPVYLAGIAAQSGASAGFSGGALRLFMDQTCGALQDGITGVVWPSGAAKPTSPATCVPVELPADLRAVYPAVLAATDLDGDGQVDLVRGGCDASTFDVRSQPLLVRYFDPATSRFVAATGPAGAKVSTIPLPAGKVLATDGDGGQDRVIPVPSLGGRPGGLLVRLQDTATGHGSLGLLTGRPARWAFTDADPFGGSGVDGAALFVPAPGGTLTLLAWSVDGEWATMPLDDALAPVLSELRFGAVAFPVDAGCTSDLSGDGLADLVVGGQASGTADLVLGDGDGGFGRRAHHRGMVWPIAAGDLDGDGVGDLVAREPGVGLATLLGGGGQVAWGPRLATSAVAAVAVGPFVGGVTGDSVIFQDTAGAFRLVPNQGGGTFGLPQPIPSVAPGGAPIPTFFILWPAALGGSDPGPDLVSMENDNFGTSWIHVLLRQSGRIVDLRSQQLGNGGAIARKSHSCWALPVGGGGAAEASAVAAVCNVENGDPQPTANVVAWTGATVGAAGATLSPWIAATSTAALGGDASVTMAGTMGGNAVFLVSAWSAAAGATRLQQWTFPGPGASAADPATWSPTKADLAGVPAGWAPFFAAEGDLDGDGVLDVVAAGDGRTVVFRNAGTNASPQLVFWYEVAGGGLPLAIGPVARLGTGALVPGVFTFAGDFENLGLTSEVVLLAPDLTTAAAFPPWGKVQ